MPSLILSTGAIGHIFAIRTPAQNCSKFDPSPAPLLQVSLATDLLQSPARFGFHCYTYCATDISRWHFQRHQKESFVKNKKTFVDLKL